MKKATDLLSEIYIIAIPHQSPATTIPFKDGNDIIDYANQYEDDYIVEILGLDYVSNIEQAIEAIQHDWHGAFVICDWNDLSNAQSYAGHQYSKVTALADKIKKEELSLIL